MVLQLLSLVQNHKNNHNTLLELNNSNKNLLNSITFKVVKFMLIYTAISTVAMGNFKSVILSIKPTHYIPVKLSWV